jgi:hypothetical protein
MALKPSIVDAGGLARQNDSRPCSVRNAPSGDMPEPAVAAEKQRHVDDNAERRVRACSRRNRREAASHADREICPLAELRARTCVLTIASAEDRHIEDAAAARRRRGYRTVGAPRDRRVCAIATTSRPSLCGGPRASHDRRLRAEPFRGRFR